MLLLLLLIHTHNFTFYTWIFCDVSCSCCGTFEKKKFILFCKNYKCWYTSICSCCWRWRWFTMRQHWNVFSLLRPFECRILRWITNEVKLLHINWVKYSKHEPFFSIWGLNIELDNVSYTSASDPLSGATVKKSFFLFCFFLYFLPLVDANLRTNLCMFK